jgi:threonyl-tRNA synthetase
MIHRALMGSLERFFGILIEHFVGAFPTWLAPVQVILLPIADSQHEYARQLQEKLKAEGIRVESDLRPEKLGHKIREAQLQKIPYMVVLGAKELESGSVAPRSRSRGDLGSMKLEAFISALQDEIKNRQT